MYKFLSMITSRSQLTILLLPTLVFLLLYAVFSGSPDTQWLPPGIEHPLGTDEFGRDILSITLAATAYSLIKGLFMTAVTMTLALFLAEIITLCSSKFSAFIVKLSANIIDSVPAVLWVMIMIIVIPSPRFAVVTLAFSLVSLPFALNIISGEFLRLRSQPFVESAYLLGLSEPRILLRYLLPNMIEVLKPYTIQLLGIAIAIDGAIGVIGLGNRSDLDLGIFLLRGKEHFILHPQLLLAALTMYVIMYSYLVLSSGIAKRISDDR